MNGPSNRQLRAFSPKSYPTFEDWQPATHGGAGRRILRWLEGLETSFDDWRQWLTTEVLLPSLPHWRRRVGLELLEDRCVLAAPVVSVLPIAPQEGLTFNGVVANVIDPGNNEPAADYSAVINWGDCSGSSTATLSGPTGGPFNVNASHTYAEEGQYGLTVSVTNNALADTWTTEASMPTASYTPAAAGANGLIYVFGGENSTGYLNAVQAYNPSTNSWTTEPNTMPTAGDGQAAVETNGLIYVFGGYGSSGTLNTVQIFNPSTDTWTTGPNNMPTSASGVAAAVGANGLIYVFGGYNSSTGYLNTVQVYNPLTSSWTSAATMPTITGGEAAAVGANGLMYVFGGYNGSYLNTVQAFNPSTNSWNTEASMPTASWSLAAAAGPNGLIYVFGGYNPSNGVLNTVQVYNPFTNGWTTAPSLATATEGPAAVTGPNGQLYVFGGFGSNSVQALNTNTGSGATPIEVIDQAPVVSGLTITPRQGIPFNGAVATFTDPGGPEPAANYSATINWGDGSGSLTDSSISYNAATKVFTVYGSHLYAMAGSDSVTVTVTDDGGLAGAGTWTTAANLPTAVTEAMSAAGANGLIYVFGGYNGTSIVNTVQAYNPATNMWTTVAPMPIATDDAAVAAGGNGLIYVFGGDSSTSFYGNAVQAYNPATNTWTMEASMPIASLGAAAAAGANGLIYVFGGTNSPNAILNTVQAYNPATNTWTAVAPMPTATLGPAVAAGDNGLLYVFGGSGSGGQILNTAQAYNPVTNTWTAVAPMPSYENILTATSAPNGLLYVFGFYKSVQAYDPAANSWTFPAAVPSFTLGPTAAVGSNGQVYVIGGQALNGTPLNTVQTYPPLGMSSSATGSATVAGPPVVNAPSNQNTLEGHATTFALSSFTDPVSSDSPWLVNINWGDGSGNSTFNVNSMGSLGSLAHTYASYGADTVTITVTDSAGASGSNSFTVTVASLAPVVSVLPLVAQAGVTFNGVVANVIDPGRNEPAADYSAVINWGDGSSASTVTLNGPVGGPFMVNGSHTYTDQGQDTLTVTVTNNGATENPGNGQAQVMVLPPGYAPAQLRQAYGFDSISFANGVVGNGAGQTIAIVVAYSQPNITSDLQAFDQEFGLPDPPSFTVVAPQGTSNAPLGYWGIEASLDVEWVHALAPGANILLVEARSAGTDLFAAVDYARQQPNVSVISMSWGFPEFSGETNYDQYFTTPLPQTGETPHTGETFIAATGDQGAPGNYPAFSPNVLAVGGTMFATPLDAQGDYPGEVGWSDSGGGISQYEGQPSYQTGVVTQTTTARTTPDVSFDAGGYVAVYDSYDQSASDPWLTEGGTSLATLGWTALIATADQGTSLLGEGTLTNSDVEATLYNIASVPGSFGFNDITSGNNGFAAGSGYDLVTGLGTPQVAALVAGLSSNIGVPTPLSPSGVLTNYSVPAFQWSAVPGAYSYHLVVTDTGSNTKVVDVNVVGATSYTPSASTFQPGHFYQWQVQANPILAGQGALSTPVTFSLPALGTPGSTSPSGEIATTTPTFSWSAVTGAAYYDITIIDQANPSVVLLSASGITGTSYVPSTPLLSGHDYEWYVQAYILFGGVPYASAATNVTYFSINSPGTPTLLSPGPNATVTTDMPTFSWSSVVGVNGYYLTILDVTTGTPVLNDWLTGINPNGQPFTSFTLSTPLISGHQYEWTLGSSGGSGLPSSNFTVAVPGAGSLPAPVPSGPNGIVTTNRPTFSWSAVPGATGYALYIFDAFNVSYEEDLGGSEPEPINVVGQTSYTIPLGYQLSGETAYSWYVMAYDSAGDVSEPSTLVDFAPSVASSVPVPNLNAPLGTQTTYDPTFQWSAVTNAVDYSLTIFDETLHAFVFWYATTENSYTVGSDGFSQQLVNGHTYRWYLNAQDATTYDYSAFALGTFTLAVTANTAPTLISPSQGATVNTTTPTFQWTAVSGAVSYSWVLIDPTDLGPLPLSVSVSGTSYTPSAALLNGHTYQWEVNAFISSGGSVTPGPESALNTFTVSAPTTPTLIGPSGADTTTVTPTFQWSDDSSASEYALYVTDTTTNTPIFSGLRVTGTSYTPSAPLTDGDSFQWYVQAFDSSFDESPAPTPLSFTVLVPLGTPTLVLTGTVNTTTPTFQWSAVAGATGYHLTVQDTTSNTTIIDLQVTGTSYTVPASEPLRSGDHYQWTVEAFNNLGVGQAAQAKPFVVFAPYSGGLGTPTPNSPSGGLTTTTPSFSWSSVTNAAAYEIDVADTTPSAAAIVLSGVQVNGTSYTITSGSLLIAGHTYEWQVLAIDSSGDESGLSAPVLFTAGSPPAFTGAGSITFTVGIAGSFPVTVAGSPAPTLSDNNGPFLPLGVTFNPANGLLSGTPTVSGVYSDTFTATNGVGANAIQPFTLVVDASPLITSADSYTFVTSQSNLNSFSVTATGYPLPTLSDNGSALPSGVTFDRSTGVLSGTPTVPGLYSIQFSAANGIGSNVTQNFTLMVVNQQGIPGPILEPVNPPPSVDDGDTVSFTAQAIAPVSNGSPLPLTFSLSGAPTGMTVNAATGVVIFEPSEWNVQVPGYYTATVTVAVVGDSQASASESFTVSVGPSSTNPGSGATAQDNINMRTAVAAGIDNSKEYYTDLLDADYLKYVNRLPTPAELAWWYANLPIPGQASTGADFTDQEIEAYFIGSPEYITDNGGTDPLWIAGMYQSILGRPAQPSEITYWLNQKQAYLASGMSVGDADIAVAKGIVASNASESILVSADYTRYLGRSGSSTEIAYWVNLFLTGYTNEQVIAGFVGSQEFFQDHGSNIVDWLFADYQATLNRLPDPSGFTYWENQL